MNSMNIKHYDSELDVKKCFDLMKALRPLLKGPEEFAIQVQRQQKQSYKILGLEIDGKLLALAGYREAENLIHGKFIYVDDLVTAPEGRGHNYGQTVLLEICSIARQLGKEKVILDTAISNARAQKFYYREGFLGLGMHFVKVI